MELRIIELKKDDIKYIEKSIDRYSNYTCKVDFKSVIYAIIETRLVFPEDYTWEEMNASYDYNYRQHFQTYVRRKKLQKLNEISGEES